jgi:hypothetical membrane protein
MLRKGLESVTMDLDRTFGNPTAKRRLVSIFTIFGSLQFFLVTLIAAFVYPGGYNNFKYFLSDLGRVVAINGEPNTISSMLFVLTIMITSFTLVPFWLILRTLFTNSTIEKGLSSLGSIAGLTAIPLLIGAALFPTDTQFEVHKFLARFFFFFFTIAILIYSIAILINQKYSNSSTIIGLLIFLLSILFAIRIFGEFQALVQKIVIYSYIFWACVQVFYIWPPLKPKVLCL